ncbi:MAG: tetratricopeptide repeat protein [Thermoguttaceae bacterium]|jgi:pimeloyl-ACP methyl ester carboxylesterase
MQPPTRKGFGIWLRVVLLAACAGGTVGTAEGREYVLKDGRVLHGSLGKVSTLGEASIPAESDSGTVQNILFLDDNLRRTFFCERLLREIRDDDNRQVDERFVIHQRVAHGGLSVKVVGRPVRVQPFDEFGHRIFSMMTAKGQVDIVQGITELTPQWTKVEGVKYVWDMRMATSSIPRDTLQKILFKQIDPKNVEHYKRIARFYLQSERYEEAKQVLENLLKAFPDRSDLKEQLSPFLRAIVQLSAKRSLLEMKLRSTAGQHQLVYAALKRFPVEGVGGDVLQGVREMMQDYETRAARRLEVVKQLRALAGRLQDTISKENLKPILAEIAAEIDENTLDRLAAFLQTASNPQTPDSEKLALAVSGWLLGADGATDELPVAISAYKVRRMIRQYLNGVTLPDRERTYSYIKQEAGGELSMVANLLSHMKPAIAPPKPVEGKPGYFEIQVPGLGKDDTVTYCIQLPPEYDPYRLYPTIVTLHGEAATASQQVDWWAGDWNKTGLRTGQATRYGYIVIAPAWGEEHQVVYGYSAREHAAVLNSLRDACRRFAIDTDRVFLSGQSIGGDAAWDIGLAHPDLWAGVMPIVAQSDRYCTFYWQNGRYVPFYIVAGELDGGKMIKNAHSTLDRWLRYGYNATVVEYLGRGHEDLYDDILRMFDWMGRYHRNFFPREFSCETMRSWDNYFWWVEVQGLPVRSLIEPSDWPPPAGMQPAQVKAKMTDKNGLNIRAGTSQVTVWLSPKMLNFKKRATITVNGRRIGDQMIHPDLGTLLEDVRTRGDRQHPFWAKIESTTGRARGQRGG